MSKKKKGKELQEALETAIYKNDLRTVKRLLDEGVDLNNKATYSQAPLTVAISQSNLKLAKLFISKGAVIDPDDFWLPSTAIDTLNLKVVKFLIKSGVNFNNKHTIGTTLAERKYELLHNELLRSSNGSGNHWSDRDYFQIQKDIDKLEKIVKFISKETEKSIKELNTKSIEKHNLARRKLGIDSDCIILLCPHCNSLFHDNNANLFAQWGILKGGGTMVGALTIHCPSCGEQDSIQEYYKSSSSHNPQF